MTFNSLHYLVFLPVVVTVYFLLPHRFRWILLLAASVYFYMCWRPEYIILLVISTSIDYVAALRMEKIQALWRRRFWLVASLVSNLGMLFLFKYYSFFERTADSVFSGLRIPLNVPHLELLLPVGISFYTFQTLSYTIDVYWKKKSAERHFGKFALYVTFFPQLVAGPIERATNLLPQLNERINRFDYARVVSGLQLVGWGLFKKVVIADNLAVYVNTVYSAPSQYDALPLILGSYFFAFQIYCDFSAYSDIAIGSARILGYDLMENFRRPYLATGISEFWKRWHISLSTWFKEYLYIPLGGNRVNRYRVYFNLLFVFMVSGLWHGANWTFIIWGGLHGSYLVCSMLTRGARDKFASWIRLDRAPSLRRAWQTVVTFHLVLFGWVFFRAGSMGDAFLILRKALTIDLTSLLPSRLVIDVAPGMGREELMTALLAMVLLVLVQLYQEFKAPISAALSIQPVALRWAVYVLLAAATMNLGMPQEIPFIYFQF